MSLKIVGGTAKGRKLRGPKKAEIRPASASVRKSLFDILGDVEGKTVLDLFAGTGSVGLEALSRGAASVTFVDHHQNAVSLLFHNLKQTGFLEKAHVLKRRADEAVPFLHRRKKIFDLIFVDPPYDKNLLNPCLQKLNDFNILSPDGLLLCEHSPRELPGFLSGLEKVDERKYGQTRVSFFKKSSTKM